MTARLHTLRHQEKKSAGNGHRHHHHHHHHHHHQHQQEQQNHQHQQQTLPQRTSPAPSPSRSRSRSPTPSPKHSDGRRANKPLMEKRRRARINQSLAALKALILDSARLENTKHSKLEKADILELTVRHLQRQRSLAQPGLSRYKAGYQDCSREVSRYLDAPDIITGNSSPIEPAVKQRLIRHLDSCVSELDLDLGSRPDSGLGSSPGSVIDRVPNAASPTPTDHHSTPCLTSVLPHCSSSTPLNTAAIKSEMPSEIMESSTVITRPDSSTITGDENNNSSRPNSTFGQVNSTAVDQSIDPSTHHSTIGQNLTLDQTSTQNSNMLSVVQVIPSRLPDGQVVFLLPSHYVQLAAAAAANGISIGPNPPTSVWAATNMSLLKATDKVMKRSHCNNDDITANIQDWTSNGTKPAKSPRIELADQPLDFTTTSKNLGRSITPIDDKPRISISESDIDDVMLIQEKSSSHDHTQTAHHMMNVISLDTNIDPLLSHQQSVKDEEGMWRPW